MIEQWREVKGFEDCYMVSDRGRLRAMERTVIYSDNRIRTFPSRLLTVRRNRATGYVQVGLYRNNRVKQAYIHRLVAEAFILNPNGKRCVNHIDGVRSHNHVQNLEWCTYAENIGHAHATGLARALCGEDSKNSKVTWKDAQALRNEVWVVVGKWAKANGVDPQTAWDIISQKSWRQPSRREIA